MSMWLSRLLTAVALAYTAQRASASAFLDKTPVDEFDLFEDVAILDQLEESLGTSHRRATEQHIWSLSKSLSSIFRALPKNDRGTVSAATARYAIHQVFLERHGWQMKGLSAGGQMWSSSSPVSALGDRLSGSVHDIFEERLGARGFDQHDLAALAATLEHLIHREVVGRLEATYKTLGRRLDRKLDKNSVLDIVDTYMASYFLDHNISEMSREQAGEMVKGMRSYPGWDALHPFARTTLRETAGKRIGMAFSDVTRAVERISEGLGRTVTVEPVCKVMMERLLDLEDGNGTGRVRLSEFHASTVRKGYWWFRENADYLRYVGALDECNPSAPRVIIPNYVHTPMNCVTSSKYYAVCCPDACENMMAHLEGEIQAPHASPEVIADVVSAWLSSSTNSRQTLSAALISKLSDVAKQNDGVVPLHGRMFAQWMHFVNPRECQYPHLSNTASYTDMYEYKRITGKAHAYTSDELRHMFGDGTTPEVAGETRASDSADSNTTALTGGMSSEEHSPEDDSSLCSAMWEPVEELLDPVHGVAKADGRQVASFSRTCLRILAMVAVAGCMCAVLRDSMLGASMVSTRSTKGIAQAGSSFGVFV